MIMFQGEYSIDLINYKIILLILYLANINYSQNKIINYEENINKIKFIADFGDYEYSSSKSASGITTITFNGFTDYAMPGEVCIPHKDILIALPGVCKVILKYSIINKTLVTGIPSVNPSVIQVNDSTLRYESNIHLRKNTIISAKPSANLIGYTWIRDYYCAVIRINSAMNSYNKIEIPTSVNFELIFNEQSSQEKTIKKKDNEFKETLSGLILNYDNALPLQKNLCMKKKQNSEWIDYDKYYVKLGTAFNNIYKITLSDLINLGADISGIDPKSLRLFKHGVEVPIHVEGEDDGFFDSDDFIEFYGERNKGDPDYRSTSRPGEEYKEYRNRYSDTTVYFLIWGNDEGLRARLDSDYVQTLDTLNSYTEIAHYEEDRWLDYSIENIVERQEPYWKSNQTWVWGQQHTGTVKRSFYVTNVVPDTKARAFFKVQSFASDIKENAHKVGISINNDTEVFDSTYFNKFEQKVITAEFNSNLLLEGSNNLRTSVFPTNAVINSIEYDWYEVEYQRYLMAGHEPFEFKFGSIPGNGLYNIMINTVALNDPVIYKINPAIKKIINYNQSDSHLIICDTVSVGDKYFILPSQQNTPSPKFYYYKRYRDLTSSENQADYIIITNKKFLEHADSYADFITVHYKLKSMVVDDEDVYDLFNYGFFSPEPIREFLESAFLNWDYPKPSYLLLLGDANYDYHGNKSFYFDIPLIHNYVPSFGEPVSDNWFGIWDSTDFAIPQLFIGRLPVNTVDEFEHYFQKHREYVERKQNAWNKRTLHLSGGNDNDVKQITELKNVNEEIISSVIAPPPFGGISRHLYKTVNPRTTFGPYTNHEVEKILSEGGVVISYIGHSGTQIWDNGIRNVKQLRNEERRSSLISDFGCSTGKFAEPDIKSFSELFVCGPDGDAIAYIANSSLGFASTSNEFPKLFYSELFKYGNTSIGNALLTAKTKLINKFGYNNSYKVFFLMNTLIGDPVIRLNIPTKANLSFQDSFADFNPQKLTTSTDSVQIIIPYKNLGIIDTSGFTTSVKHHHENKLNEEKYLKNHTPINNDSLAFFVKIKNMEGSHVIELNLDCNNNIEESDENDNNLSFTLTVFNDEVKVLLLNDYANGIGGEITVLIPSVSARKDSLITQISRSGNFINPVVITTPAEKFFTDIKLPALEVNKRYWARCSLTSRPHKYSAPVSFIYKTVGSKSYLLTDSLSFSHTAGDCQFTCDGVALLNIDKIITVSSAGFYDGGYAAVEIDGHNFLPEGHLDGLHVAVFSMYDNKFIKSGRFNYWDNPSSFADDFREFINSINENLFAVFANCGGGGYGFTQEMKNIIKLYGSAFVDSIGFRHSWAMIGRKGASSGSVPESWHKPFDGAVLLKDTISLPQLQGVITSENIGPVGEWKTAELNYTAGDQTKLSITPVVINKYGNKDTLAALFPQKNIKIPVGINAVEFPQLSYIIKMERRDDAEKIKLHSFEVSYLNPAELGIAVSEYLTDVDTIVAGISNDLKLYIYNAGEVKSDSVKISLEVEQTNNSKVLIRKIISPGIDSMTVEKMSLSYIYKTEFGLGNRKFWIKINQLNNNDELYPDNNYLQIPVSIVADTNETPVLKPSVSVFYDGVEIMDGDYISANPEIVIQLNYDMNNYLPDTNKISFSLNGERINYSEFNIKQSNSARQYFYIYNPELPDGEYTFRIYSDLFSNYEKSFIVRSNLTLIDIYNYPNPFPDNTYFTFRLTRIPDKLAIKIYTVAGRLIRIIDINQTQLKTDFNCIHWDGRDEDGNRVSNGVYFYKITAFSGGENCSATGKMAKVN